MRFMARRGNVKEIRSDNGTNFVGAHKELREQIANWNQQQVKTFLLQRSVRWKFNPPAPPIIGASVNDKFVRLEKY